MLAFQIDDMTCQHCVGVITRAVQGQDVNARVSVDLPTHRLQVDGSALSARQVLDLLQAEGYSPQQL